MALGPHKIEYEVIKGWEQLPNSDYAFVEVAGVAGEGQRGFHLPWHGLRHRGERPPLSVAGATAGAVLDAITVQVRDALGNAVTSYAGPVTLTLSSGVVAAESAQAAPFAGDSAQALMTGPITVTAVAGVATFPNVQIGPMGPWQFTASATGLVSVTGPVFTVMPGAASALTLVSGGSQSANAGAALPQPVVVKVSDAFGNGVGGVTVTFSPAAGSVSPTTAQTSTAGAAQTMLCRPYPVSH